MVKLCSIKILDRFKFPNLLYLYKIFACDWTIKTDFSMYKEKRKALINPVQGRGNRREKLSTIRPAKRIFSPTIFQVFLGKMFGRMVLFVLRLPFPFAQKFP